MVSTFTKIIFIVFSIVFLLFYIEIASRDYITKNKNKIPNHIYGNVDNVLIKVHASYHNLVAKYGISMTKLHGIGKSVIGKPRIGKKCQVQAGLGRVLKSQPVPDPR